MKPKKTDKKPFFISTGRFTGAMILISTAFVAGSIVGVIGVSGGFSGNGPINWQTIVGFILQLTSIVTNIMFGYKVRRDYGDNAAPLAADRIATYVYKEVVNMHKRHLTTLVDQAKTLNNVNNGIPSSWADPITTTIGSLKSDLKSLLESAKNHAYFREASELENFFANRKDNVSSESEKAVKAIEGLVKQKNSSPK